MIQPKVSIAIITFHHEAFLAQALESVLRQKTDFPVEIVVGEDGSTDGTREILKQFASRHPDLIVPLYHDRNIGMLRNLQSVLLRCRGEYVALLEGDDYWSAPHKLQKQADFLDSHSAFTACAHNALRWDESRHEASGPYCIGVPSVLKLRDLIVQDPIPTCSVMFRNRRMELPDWYFTLGMGDWPLHILNARHGDFSYDPESMAVYRLHSDSIWAGKSRISQINRLLRAHEVFNREFDFKFDRPIREMMSLHLLEMASWQGREGDRADGLRSLARSLRMCPLNPRRRTRDLLKTALQLMAPAFYSLARRGGWVERPVSPTASPLRIPSAAEEMP